MLLAARRLVAPCLLALTVAVVSIAPAPAAAAGSCANGVEADALRLRTLQNRLMVAALSCGEQQRYDAFIGRFDHVLAADGRTLGGYFNRRHGNKGRRLLGDYLTAQANMHSLDSLQDRAGFCRDAHDTFTALLDGDETTARAASAALPTDRIQSHLACLAPDAARAPAAIAPGAQASQG